MQPTPQDERIAHSLADCLRQAFDVRQILWFGSRADGTGNAESDWDLLVVACTTLDPWSRMTLALKATRALQVPRDIFVATPEEFAAQKTRCGTIAWAAARGGRPA